MRVLTPSAARCGALPCARASLRAARFGTKSSAVVRAATTDVGSPKSTEEAVSEVPAAAPVQMASEDSSGGDDFRVSSFATKIICTIGPETAAMGTLLQMAQNGMTVARLNMTHGEREWHIQVIENVRKLHSQHGYCVAIMMDTEGSEVHLRARDPCEVKAGEQVTFSVRADVESREGMQCFSVSYDAFVDDVMVGDLIIVDGGMAILKVDEMEGPEVRATVIEPGPILSRANLTFRRGNVLVRGRNAMLPVITSKDWQDIDFAIAQEVDFLAVSFVKSAELIHNLKSYIGTQLQRVNSTHKMEVIAKLESYESIGNMGEIIAASDGVMVARGDLSAQIPFEDVPAVQKEIVFRCRQAGRPVIVASQLLSSMMAVPVPTRAEVADCADVVRQQADALMLSGETAAGKHAVKCVETLKNVCIEVEGWSKKEKFGAMSYPTLSKDSDERVSEEICTSAAILADSLGAAAIVVYTRRGHMATFLSRRRPSCPILAVTDYKSVQRKMALRWGVTSFLHEMDEHPEENVEQFFKHMKEQDLVSSGDLVVVVSDIRPVNDVIRSVQVRHVM